MQYLYNENDQLPFLSSSGQRLRYGHRVSMTKQFSRHFLRLILKGQIPGDSGDGCDSLSTTAMLLRDASPVSCLPYHHVVVLEELMGLPANTSLKA